MISFNNTEAMMGFGSRAAEVDARLLLDVEEVFTEALSPVDPNSVGHASLDACPGLDDGLPDSKCGDIAYIPCGAEFRSGVDYMYNRAVANIHDVHVYFLVESELFGSKAYTEANGRVLNALTRVTSLGQMF